MAAVVAGAGADLCLMHMLGEPRTMQDDPRYDDVVAEVESFLAERAEVAVAAGIRARAHRARPGHRLRQDARAQSRAAARAAAPGAARPAPARRLAQALPGHAHAAARSQPTAWRPRLRPRSTATAEAPTCCACTTCGPRPMRSPSSGRWRAWRDRSAHDRGARADRARASRRARPRARARAALRARPRARAALGARPARPTASATPSPTATPRAWRSRWPRPRAST